MRTYKPAWIVFADIPIAACADAFVRRPSEAVGQGFDGLGGPSYEISKCAIPGRERYMPVNVGSHVAAFE